MQKVRAGIEQRLKKRPGREKQIWAKVSSCQAAESSCSECRSVGLMTDCLSVWPVTTVEVSLGGGTDRPCLNWYLYVRCRWPDRMILASHYPFDVAKLCQNPAHKEGLLLTVEDAQIAVRYVQLSRSQALCLSVLPTRQTAYTWPDWSWGHWVSLKMKSAMKSSTCRHNRRGLWRGACFFNLQLTFSHLC